MSYPVKTKQAAQTIARLSKQSAASIASRGIMLKTAGQRDWQAMLLWCALVCEQQHTQLIVMDKDHNQLTTTQRQAGRQRSCNLACRLIGYTYVCTNQHAHTYTYPAVASVANQDKSEQLLAHELLEYIRGQVPCLMPRHISRHINDRPVHDNAQTCLFGAG